MENENRQIIDASVLYTLPKPIGIIHQINLHSIYEPNANTVFEIVLHDEKIMMSGKEIFEIIKKLHSDFCERVNDKVFLKEKPSES